LFVGEVHLQAVWRVGLVCGGFADGVFILLLWSHV